MDVTSGPNSIARWAPTSKLCILITKKPGSFEREQQDWKSDNRTGMKKKRGNKEVEEMELQEISSKRKLKSR